MPDAHGTSTWPEIKARIQASVEAELHPGARRLGELTMLSRALGACEALDSVRDVSRAIYAEAVEIFGKNEVDIFLRRMGIRYR